MRLLFFFMLAAASSARAQAIPPTPELADLLAADAEYKSANDAYYGAIQEAKDFGRWWGFIFEEGLRQTPPREYPYNRGLGYHRDEDEVHDQWLERRHLEEPGKSENDIESEWYAVSESLLRKYAAAVSMQSGLKSLDDYRDWRARETPLPPELPAALSRAADLLRAGRRADAAKALDDLAPWARVFPPLAHALQLNDMTASADFSYRIARIDTIFSALRRDREGRYREIAWEFDCRHLQSLRFGEFLYPSVPGQNSIVNGDALVNMIEPNGGAEEKSVLKEFLSGHDELIPSAVRAGRAQPVCRVVRVAQDGTGDALTISDALRALGGQGNATILVEPGRYEESVPVDRLERIVLRSRVPRGAVLVPPAGQPGVSSWQTNGLVIDGFSFDLTGGGGALRVSGSSGVTLKHCRIDAASGAILTSETSQDVYIWDCDA